MLHYYIDIFLNDKYFLDETYGRICSFPPPKWYVQKLRKPHDFLRGKNFPRNANVSAKYFTSARRKPQKRVDRSRKTDAKRGTTEGQKSRGWRHHEDARGFRSNRGSENWWLDRVQKLSAAVGSGISISRYVARIATRYLFGGLARFQISAGKYGDIE